MPTLRRTADVRGRPRVDGALGVLGQGVLPRPVEVVHLVLHKATDLLVLKAAGVICREGQGMVSCSFSNLLPEAAWLLEEGTRCCCGTAAALCGAEGRWAAPGPRRRLERNISVISVIMEGLIQADGCNDLAK